MNRVYARCLLCFVLLTVTQGSFAWAQSEKASKAPSLYQRIGGYDALAAIFDEVGGRMAADPQLEQFFKGHSTDTLLNQRQRALEFLCHEMGGPCAYTGRPLKRAHGGLGITESQWKAFLGHLTATLDHQKIAEKEKGEMLALVGHFKSEIAEKK
jgi:hemoglobin